MAAAAFFQARRDPKDVSEILRGGGGGAQQDFSSFLRWLSGIGQVARKQLKLGDMRALQLAALGDPF